MADTTRMLVVPSETLAPLSTPGPIPTDGQPEWWRCRDKSPRVKAPRDWPMPSCCSPEGPFPFTVAVWQEVKVCRACGQSGDAPICDGFDNGQPYRLDTVGAVVATVKVTGPGHHADDCAHDAPGEVHGFPQGRVREVERRYCHPDALPDCWHTPTSTVARLDVPIPMERPTAKAEGHFGEIKRPASWWWADIDLEAPGE